MNKPSFPPVSHMRWYAEPAIPLRRRVAYWLWLRWLWKFRHWLHRDCVRW